MQHLYGVNANVVLQSGENLLFHFVVLCEHFGESLSSIQTLMKFPENLLLKQPGEFGGTFPADMLLRSKITSKDAAIRCSSLRC